MFYLVTLVYPRCAQTCLQLFSFTKLDVGTYLSADFTILVRDIAGHWGKLYVRYLFPGIALMLLFAIGLPVWYLYIMWTIRNRLEVNLHFKVDHAFPCLALRGALAFCMAATPAPQCKRQRFCSRMHVAGQAKLRVSNHMDTSMHDAGEGSHGALRLPVRRLQLPLLGNH